MPPRKSHFGSIRKLPSGRYQARYRHDGLEHAAPDTFRTKADAQAWLAETQTDLRRGSWVNPRSGDVALRNYAETWLSSRPDLRPSTKAKYRYLLDLHILPVLGSIHMSSLQPTDVRQWWARLAADKPTTAAGAYRLLATICNTALADQLISRSPCRVRGAASERSAERPSASIAEVATAIEAVPERLRPALMLAAWCQLRRGEILGLQRRDVDLVRGQLHIERSIVVHMDGTHAVGPPKTKAGQRLVAVPAHVMQVLDNHLDKYVDSRPKAWLFASETGNGTISARTLSRAWERARKDVGRTDLHLHDLRHSGLTWAAATGATTAELMRRAGHASPVAALRYQHATDDRDHALAIALTKLASETASID